MVIEVNGNSIEFDEVTQELDVIDCYDREVEVIGYDENGTEYTAVGMESCGELVEIDEDSVWEVTQGGHDYETDVEYLEWLVDNNPDDGSWEGR